MKLNNDLIKDLSRLGLILAEKNRVKILLLLKNKELTASNIHKQLRLPQNLSSHHLQTLSKTGVIKSKKSGRFIYYSLDRLGIKILASKLKNLI